MAESQHTFSSGGKEEDQENAKLLLALNQMLLDSIANVDYETYDRLCDDEISCLEPESKHNLVVGKAFHEYYFNVFGDAGSGGESNSMEEDEPPTSPKTQTNVTMVQPHVQWIRGNHGEASGAVLTYVKLTQQTKEGKDPVTIQQSETRVWEKKGEKWVNIHFHKSPYR